MKTVLLKLAGPLQSWGTGSHFETRHTDTHPSKSGVIGMIAAGLGYSRDEDERLDKLNSLSFAVRIDQLGQLLRDYHTAKKYKENGDFERTYVTNRYYLQDAVFVVALCSNDEELNNPNCVKGTQVCSADCGSLPGCIRYGCCHSAERVSMAGIIMV